MCDAFDDRYSFNSTRLTARTENVAHKLYMENVFLSPELFDNCHIKTINCSTVTSTQTEKPGNFAKTL